MLPILVTAALVVLCGLGCWMAFHLFVKVSLSERPRMVSSGLGRILARRGKKSLGAFIDELGDQLRALDFDAGLVEELTEAVVQTKADNAEALIDAISSSFGEARAPAWDLDGEAGAERSTKLVMVVGVNGSGKTTSCGKLAWRLRRQGLDVMLAAADTFRAGAIEQLQEWGKRVEVPVYAKDRNADPASVIHDALVKARGDGADVLIADTSGRLDNKGGLMRELGRMAKVAAKVDAGAPHECLLVLDANTGKASTRQAERFAEVVDLTGLVLTKLDGSASGGTVVSLHRKLGLPVRYMGTGEKPGALIPFDPHNFATSMVREAALWTAEEA